MGGRRDTIRDAVRLPPVLGPKRRPGEVVRRDPFRPARVPAAVLGERVVGRH